MASIKTIGYPFVQTSRGLFNPITDIAQNARCKLINLLYTNKGQRVLAHNCQFGVDITKLLFQNLGYTDFQDKVAQQITKAIKVWIPEITYVKTVIEKLQNTLTININFKVNEVQNTVYLELNLDEQ